MLGPIPTECIPGQLAFEDFDSRKVVASFDGGAITTDAGTLLFRHADKAIRLFDRVASCFDDRRDPDCMVHCLRTLIGQCIAAIALGYEDVEDHDRLRHGPVLALLSDRLAPKCSSCALLAGKSTLNRLEHAPSDRPTRYHRIGHSHTQFANVTCGTIRLSLLKIGAQVQTSVRRIKIAMASANPWRDEFRLAHCQLSLATA